jgi:hypothetical protein
MVLFCDNCGCEFPASESTPHPETEIGDYCFECHLELEHNYDVERGVARLKLELPSMKEFMKGFKNIAKGSSDPRKMEGNCHAAATILVELLKNKLDIKLQRGHWVGTDARSNSRHMQQHSWTKIKLPDIDMEFIVDPTQWVFTGASQNCGLASPMTAAMTLADIELKTQCGAT